MSVESTKIFQKGANEVNAPATVDALSPEQILRTIQVDTPRMLVMVQGKVTNVKVYPNWVYGTLESINGIGAIRFKCPREAAPKVEEQVATFEGVLTVQSFSTKQAGLGVTLEGRCLGGGQCVEEEPPIITLKDRRTPKVSLKRFIDEKEGLKGIGIIGTYTGINDLRHHSERDDSEFAFVANMSFGNPAALITAVKEKSASAVIFARGGDDESIGIWNRPEFISELNALGIPYYTAIGHAHRLTLADNYADDFFATPTACGAAIKMAISELEKYKKSLWILTSKNNHLSEANTRMNGDYKKLKTNFKYLLIFSAIITACTLLMVFNR